MVNNKKIGFLGVLSIVLSSQLGSGSFFLPTTIAQFGISGIFSWFFTGAGAIIFALMFAILCRQVPETGGPHVYIIKAFGKCVGFFSAWSYWVISWVSNCVLLFLITGALETSFVLSNTDGFLIQLCTLILIMISNLFGIHSSGLQNSILAFLKLFPIVTVCICGWKFVNFDNFILPPQSTSVAVTAFFSGAIATLWAFVGVESATTPAGNVRNPQKNIFLALIIGEILVCIIYFASCIVLYGVYGPDLSNMSSPYINMLNMIFNLSEKLAIWTPFLIIPVCIASLNTWTIVSGQIALGASESGIFPKFLSNKNKYGAPYIAIMLSTFIQIPFLFASYDKTFLQKVSDLADFSAGAFFLIYFVCALSFIKIFRLKYFILSVLSICFCLWIFFTIGLTVILKIFLIPITGLPVYFFMKRRSIF